MAGTTRTYGLTVPDDGDNVDDIGALVAEAFEQAEPYFSGAFDNAAERDAAITKARGNYFVGMRVYLLSEGYVSRLTSDSGSALVWVEQLDRAIYYRASNQVNSPTGVPANAPTFGCGQPGPMTGTLFSRGGNGPVVPVDGYYVAELLAAWNTAPVSNTGATDSRAYVQIGLNGPTVLARTGVPYLEDFQSVTTGPLFLNAGAELTGALYYNGSSAKPNIPVTVTWTVKRV